MELLRIYANDRKDSEANTPLTLQGTVGKGRDIEPRSSHQAEAGTGWGGPIPQEMEP